MLSSTQLLTFRKWTTENSQPAKPTQLKSLVVKVPNGQPKRNWAGRTKPTTKTHTLAVPEAKQETKRKVTQRPGSSERKVDEREQREFKQRRDQERRAGDRGRLNKRGPLSRSYRGQNTGFPAGRGYVAHHPSVFHIPPPPTAYPMPTGFLPTYNIMPQYAYPNVYPPPPPYPYPYWRPPY